MRHRIRDRAGRGADHRQPVRDRLGERYAVALVARRQHEQVGVRMKLGEAIVRDRAEDGDSLAEAVMENVGVERGRGRRAAHPVARNGQAPRQILEVCERRHQHVVALAPHQRADREQRDRAVHAPRVALGSLPGCATVMSSGSTL